jgi:alpha-ketoglutarate-dependent 2,4-dichlorophenoxyacetate dioxygenase
MADNAAETGSALAGRRKFKTFRVKELHPTFGAEIEGVDFPSPSEEQFQEILEARAKVTASSRS